MLHVEKYESNNFKMLTAVSCLVNSINMELCEHSWSVPRSDSIRRSHTAGARLLDRHIYENKEDPHSPADATASARYHLKLVSEGNFITNNIAVRYQLYVIGGSQADD